LLQRQILVPIRKLNGIIQKLGNGIIPASIPDYHNLELRSMVESLQRLCLGFKRTSEFAQKVGEGDFNVTFTKLSEEDVLGNALLRMHDNLKRANEGDRQRYWAAEGFTMINSILQSGLKLQQLSERCLAKLVRYMGARQGAMFILNNQNPNGVYMELISTFACEDMDPLERIEPGENLIGQCWIEKKTVYLEAIPKGYVKISSGLGSADPNNILIVPLIIHNEVYGIIELASFDRFEKYQQTFLEDLGETIASTIYNQKVKERTTRLMIELQERASA
jgi:GAF domain-containing protein